MTERVNILLAIHGHEPEGWADEVRVALTPNPQAVIRVLVVDEPAPAGFTSLLSPARRRYAQAVRLARGLAAEARQRRLDALLARLPARPEVVHAACEGDEGRTIAAHAAAWPAHIVVVGRDARTPLPRWLVAAIHERVVREAPCAVIVATPAPRRSARSGRGLDPVVTALPR
jgi:nucleotide-binding universal stress UspA family protein